MIWIPTPALPYGPAANDRPHPRPNRCEHPTTRSGPSEDSPCASPCQPVLVWTCCCPGVTVLSAVGIIRRNMWSEAQARQCPQRACAMCALPRPLARSRLHPRPRGQRVTSARTRGRISQSSRHTEAVAGVDQRNGSPERQMLWRITASLRASATRALPDPDRLAIASAQSFRLEARFTRVRRTKAAS